MVQETKTLQLQHVTQSQPKVANSGMRGLHNLGETKTLQLQHATKSQPKAANSLYERIT